MGFTLPYNSKFPQCVLGLYSIDLDWLHYLEYGQEYPLSRSRGTLCPSD